MSCLSSAVKQHISSFLIFQLGDQVNNKAIQLFLMYSWRNPKYFPAGSEKDEGPLDVN